MNVTRSDFLPDVCFSCVHSGEALTECLLCMQFHALETPPNHLF